MSNYIRKVLRQETYLGTNKKNDYFEGWYFKIMTRDKKNTIALIPGVTKGTDAHAFIQVIDNIKNKSYYFRYELDDFYYSNNPFYLKIGNNIFSLKKIVLDIKEINLKGKVYFNELLPINKSIYSPNIMGPFAYLTFMECNHGVISLNHRVNGKVSIHHKRINFKDAVGYIEKDYGVSFPKKYIWLQANDNNNNIFLSIAKIPFKLLTFDGLIGILMINGKEYRFATYNLSKLIEFKIIDKDNYFIKIKKGNLYLEIDLQSGQEITLLSPNKGRMNDNVKESLNSIIKVKLIRKNEVLFEQVFDPCTTEVLW